MTAPSLRAGSILTPNINVTVAPGTPRIMLDIDPGNVGLSAIEIEMASPDNVQFVLSTAFQPPYPPVPKHEKLTVQVSSPFANQGFGFYSEPGAWTLSEIVLVPKTGNPVSYSGSQLAALFPSIVINVTNPGTPDVTPPKIGHGKVLTPTVSLSSASPYFAARLKVSDSNSGVSNIYMSFNAPDGSFGYGAYSTILSPVNKGSVIASMMFQPTAPTGTYTIASLSVCDVANNCAEETAPEDIQKTLGTTTFQVTN